MKNKILSYIRVFSFLTVIIFIFYVFFGGNIIILKNYLILLFIVICLLLLIIEQLLYNIIYEQKFKFFSKEKQDFLYKKNKNYFFYLYKSIFEYYNEKDIEVIDHDFDGIVEYNNKLPSWWVNLFYFSIIFSIIYFLAFCFTDFAHPQKEYDLAYKKYIYDIKEYEKKIPQANLMNSIFKSEVVSDGKIYFEQICATCHKSDGSGSTGPNLTDEYWINITEKNLYKNIFSIIWNGSKNNPTMRGFGISGELKGNDIEKIASYVYYINKNKNKPITSKSPQGKKMIW